MMGGNADDPGFHMLTVTDIMVYFDNCKKAEARLAAKRSARVEAREIRMKELERQQKEIYQVQKVSDDEERMSVGSRSNIQVNDRLEQDYLEKGSSRASTISGATLTSLGEMSSRRGSGDTSITVDTEPSIREIKDVLLEVEEKYRKAMVSNAQLDNEKTNLIYEVDTLKDSLIELEEMLFETRHDLEDKNKNLEREKHAHSILQFQFNELKVTLKQSEELLTEIRQLRLKQDGSIREISDLQETIEWKNKKIGALERQKEFSDAIRNERDELRDEVIQLKDILKKHGIVLGPDLATNGETGEQAGEADQNSQTSPVEIRERSSVLGSHQLDLCKDQHQKDLDEEVQLSSNVPISSTKTSLKANENGEHGDKLNQAVEQSENRPEIPPSSVGDEAGPIDEIKATESVPEDSGDKIVELECDVHSDAHTETDQQDGMISVDLSQVIKEETPMVSVSVPIPDKDQPGEAELENESKEEPVESFKTEKLSQTQDASVSNKKKKKKKKGKQKLKQSDKKESGTEMDDKNEKILTENNPNQKMENDQEANHEEYLGNDVSKTTMNTKDPADSQDDKIIECVEIPSTNVNADDARDQFQTVTDEADSGKSSKSISNFDCPESKTCTGVLLDDVSQISITNPTTIIDEQTEDSKIAGQEIVIISIEIDSSEKEASLSHKLSFKPMDDVSRHVEHHPESIYNSDVIENSLLIEVNSDLDSDTVEQEAMHQNIDPDGTTFRDGHDDSAQIHSSFSVLKKSENEAETEIQEKPTEPIDQVLEIHLQDSVIQNDTKTQQAELVKENLIISSDKVIIGDNAKYTSVTETLVQHIGEEGEEEDRSLQVQVKPEAHLSGEDEANQESVESGVSHQENMLEKGEDDEKEKSVQDQVIPEAQLSEADEANQKSTESGASDQKPKLEKGEDDENEKSVQDQVIPEAQLSEADEANQESTESGDSDQKPKLEKGEDDENEKSVQDQVIPEVQLSEADEANQESTESGDSDQKPKLVKGEDDEKEKSVQDQVIPEAQLSGEDEANQESTESGASDQKPKLVKGEDDEKEKSVQDQVTPEAPLSGENGANQESGESEIFEELNLEKDEEDEKERLFQDQIMLDAQLPGEDDNILGELDEEDGEDEGESFDFDENDLEASSDEHSKNSLDQPNIHLTLLKENVQGPSQEFQSDVIDEDRTQKDCGTLDLGAQQPKPKEQMDDGLAIENPQTTTEVVGYLTEHSHVDKEVQPNHQQHDTPENKQYTVEKHLQATEDVRYNEGFNLISEMERRDVGQKIIHHKPKISGEQEVQKETAGGNKEDDRKESKKTSKKGKGKGKEECKMS
ncbi:centrosomal protein of 290 kDa-like isoform X4 [Xyrauchen texanus]|uniref:centrosomal protein of 290 kDa-like isoform X4 n=1 Tax=Xyrauchen texanus TaxID=154827 RepID=UPI0022426D1D|nr:centrosomal protein of 290 kDa-like isoform X4 [Xyrauchen texanus]